MFQSLPCPSCHRPQILPSDIANTARLRCGYCAGEFMLQEMLDKTGQWIVVNTGLPSRGPSGLVSMSPGAATVDESLGATVSERLADFEIDIDLEHKASEAEGTPIDRLAHKEGSDTLSLADDEAIHELNDDPTGDGFAESPIQPIQTNVFDSTTPKKTKVDWSKFEASSGETARSRRKAKNPLWSMLSVVAGGLASLPIATLLIWHILGKDPLEIGPPVARILPWIVPSKFHAAGGESSVTIRPKVSAEDLVGKPPERGSSGFRKFDDVMPSPSAEKVPVPAQVEAEVPVMKPSLNEDNKLEPMPVDVDQDPKSDISSAANSLELPSALSLPSPEVGSKNEPPKTELQQPNESTSTSTSNTTAGSDIFSLIREAEKGLREWDRKTQASLAATLYGQLTNLAGEIEKLKGTPVQRVVYEQMALVGKAVREKADLQELIKQGAAHWIGPGRSSINSQNLTLISQIESIVEADGYWDVKSVWDTNSDSSKRLSALELHVPKSVLPSLEVGEKRLFFGTLSANPDKPNELVFTANYAYSL